MHVAIFDFDGVLFESPVSLERDFNDPEFWEEHWANVSAHVGIPSMLILMRSLIRWGSDWHIIILTARPERQRINTLKVLNTHLFYPQILVDIDSFEPISNTVSLHLMMCDIDFNAINDWSGVAVWKHSVVQRLIHNGYDIQFMVEDNSRVAREVNQSIPVLVFKTQ